MYPVAGGTARFPHYAFGGAAGASFGWFSWLQAATVAPIEVMAVIQYGQHYSFASSWMKLSGGQHVLTANGIVAAVVLMAIFTAHQLPRRASKLANTNSAATWWKVGVPVLTIVVLAVDGASTRATSPPPTASTPTAPAACSPRSRRAASSSRCSGFEQADQLAGESAQPQARHPARGHRRDRASARSSTSCSRSSSWPRCPPSQIGSTWATGGYTTFSGPFANLASLVGLGWLATVLYIDAVISPAGTGLIYTTGASRVSYGLSRNGYVPRAFETIGPPRHPVGRPDHRVRRRLHLLPAVPELEVARRPDHERERAHVRGRAAGAGRVPPPPARRRRARTGCRARRSSRRSPSSSRTS